VSSAESSTDVPIKSNVKQFFNKVKQFSFNFANWFAKERWKEKKLAQIEIQILLKEKNKNLYDVHKELYLLEFDEKQLIQFEKFVIIANL